MRPRAVLFDVDGTIITLDIAIRNYQETCRHFRIKVLSYDELRRKVVGYTIEETVRKLFPEALSICDEFSEFFKNNQIENYRKYGGILPNVKKAFGFLRNNSIKIGIVTTKVRAESLAELGGYGLKFDALVAGDDIKYRKPSPRPVLRACRMLGVRPKDCIMIGDHRFDMMAAKSAGCTPIGVLTGWDNDRNLRKAGATNTLKNLGELIKLLKR
jgi:HAD superfamily hydrolase (TIGR01549 family)